MKVCFETFGCRLNRAEALQMEAEYLAKGWERTEKHSEADLFIVRGCSVTRRAEHDSYQLIEHLKRKYPNRAIKIFGCLKDAKKDEPASEAIPQRTARAYLKLQDGCSGRCTFCIVPKFRGKSVSTPLYEAIDKAKRFIDAGYKEIVLTGCNLALYASEGHRLPQLFERLPEGARYRIGSLEPGASAMEVVNVMSARADFCKFLHIPVQSGSNRILTAMRRPYLMKDVEALISHAIEKMPRLGLGCDLIAGFPGELEVDHTLSKNVLLRFPFSNAHVFPFSARPGTIAAGLPDQLPREISHKRAHELSHIAKERRAAYVKNFIGQDVEVIVESEEKRTGWSGEYFACTLSKAFGKLERKSLVKARVAKTKEDRLEAVPC